MLPAVATTFSFFTITLFSAFPEIDTTRLFQDALEAQDRKQWARASQGYTKILETEPDHLRARINLGLVEIHRRRIKAGLEHCKEALDQSPDATKAHYCVGLGYIRQGKAGPAGAAFARALALDPKYPEAQLEQAHIFRQARDFPAAIQLYRKAVRARPNDPDLHVHLGYCYKQTDQLPAARVEYSKAIQKDPESFFGHLNLGWVLVRLKDYAAAEPHYQKAAELRPKHPDPHYNLGQLYRRTRQPEKSVLHYDKAVKLAPNDVQARLSLARMLWRLGRKAQAEPHVQHVAGLELTKKQKRNLRKTRELLKRPPPKPPPSAGE